MRIEHGGATNLGILKQQITLNVFYFATFNL